MDRFSQRPHADLFSTLSAQINETNSFVAFWAKVFHGVEKCLVSARDAENAHVDDWVGNFAKGMKHALSPGGMGLHTFLDGQPGAALISLETEAQGDVYPARSFEASRISQASILSPVQCTLNKTSLYSVVLVLNGRSGHSTAEARFSVHGVGLNRFEFDGMA